MIGNLSKFFSFCTREQGTMHMSRSVLGPVDAVRWIFGPVVEGDNHVRACDPFAGPKIISPLT